MSEQNRIDLGCAVTDVVHAADGRLLPSASPLDRAAVRETRAQLLELASRVCDLSRPAAPRGVLLVERLLVDASGPLYGKGAPRELRAAIARALAALDGNDDPGR